MAESIKNLISKNPVLTPLVKNRPTSLIIVFVVLVHFVLAQFGILAWRCPLKSATGFPCPGCGLGTAITALLRGQVWKALQHHAFAPVFLAGFAVLAVIAILPASRHSIAVRTIASLEYKTGLFVVMLMLLVLYWIARLIFQYIV